MKVGTLVKALEGIIVQRHGTMGIIVKTMPGVRAFAQIHWSDGQRHWVNTRFLGVLK